MSKPPEPALSTAAKVLKDGLDAHDAKVKEKQRVEKVLILTARKLWRCTRHGFPHEANPIREGENWLAWTERFDWAEYTPRWVNEAMVPACEALLETADLVECEVQDLIQYEIRVAHEPLIHRATYTKEFFHGLLRAVREGNGPDERHVDELGILIAKKPGAWGHFHDYFEGAVSALKRVRLAMSTGSRREAIEATDTDRQILEARRLEGSQLERVLSAVRGLRKHEGESVARQSLEGLGIPPSTIQQVSEDHPTWVERLGDSEKEASYRKSKLIRFVLNNWTPRSANKTAGT